MKELSIKEKAKAYDEALEKARRYYECANGDEDMITMTTTMFPELKDSEDEKIRKEMLQIAKESEDSFYMVMTPNKRERLIAWLEKQGKPAGINPSEFELRLNKLLKQFETLSKEDLAGILSFYLNVVQNNGTYKPDEKQVEQKPYGQRKECVGCQFNYAGECKGYCDLKRNELANEVEPKFKVGDWVVYCGKTYQITGLHNDTFTLTSCDGSYFFNNVKSTKEPVFHLWTIQDAKDGDVLCTYECDEPKIVFVLKGTPKKHYALSYYCFYNIMYPHFDDGNKPGCLAPEDSDVKPATKEQHDTIMKAMADAGYTFDFEKKELKKIEQKPAWSEKDELSCFESALFTAFSDIWQSHLSGEEVNVEQWAKEHSKELLESAKEELKGHNSAWSGEDNKNLEKTIWYVEKGGKLIFAKTDELVSWLKSLKGRVQPQPKWSEEDENIRQWIISDINKLYHLDKKSEFLVDREIKWLKSIRPQTTWKPSEEMLEALHKAIPENVMEISEDEMLLDKLYQGLKYGKVLSEK